MSLKGLCLGTTKRESMRTLRFSIALLLSLLPALLSAEEYPSFQALVDAANENDILIPPPGTYAGPVSIEKSLVIDGRVRW